MTQDEIRLRVLENLKSHGNGWFDGDDECPYAKLINEAIHELADDGCTRAVKDHATGFGDFWIAAGITPKGEEYLTELRNKYGAKTL